MTSSLVGSEMCIRDSPKTPDDPRTREEILQHMHRNPPDPNRAPAQKEPVSYTHLTLPTICSV
eukprot:6463144-Prorocentrum_lima.AAC.1